MSDHETRTERTEAPRPSDRAVAAGYPPDSGPEQRVLFVRPAFFRGRPLRSTALLLAPFVVAAATWFIAQAEQLKWTAIAWAAAAVVLYLILFFWWVVVTRGKALEVTNKRAIEHRGLLSKSTDEVMLDHIRNFRVDQTFLQRLLGIGSVGIASSGQEGIEVEMEDLPNPHRIREIVDLYRPLD